MIGLLSDSVRRDSAPPPEEEVTTAVDPHVAKAQAKVAEATAALKAAEGRATAARAELRALKEGKQPHIHTLTL